MLHMCVKQTETAIQEKKKFGFPSLRNKVAIWYSTVHYYSLYCCGAGKEGFSREFRFKKPLEILPTKKDEMAHSMYCTTLPYAHERPFWRWEEGSHPAKSCSHPGNHHPAGEKTQEGRQAIMWEEAKGEAAR